MREMSALEYCKVGDQGVSHLFRTLDFGGVCACGRKVFAFSLRDESPLLRDRLAPHESPTDSPAAVPPADLRSATQVLMDRGEVVIEEARRLRQSCLVFRGRDLEATRAARPLREALRERARAVRLAAAAQRRP
jgi:hypothetical protein